MVLHEVLAELVRIAGADVLDDADAFRAALDDFLADENAATEGEVNLLVDAVRLGSLGRLRNQIGHGADASLAVATHGDRLAHGRGTRETGGARWALAALGYALQLVDEDEVRARHREMTHGPDVSVSPTDDLSAGQPPSDVSVPAENLPSASGHGRVTLAAPTLVPAAPRVPAAETDKEQRRTKLGLLVAVVLVLILGVGVGVGIWLGSGDESSPSSANDDRSKVEDSTNDGASSDESERDEGDASGGLIADEGARLAAIETATEFVTAFNTYGPDDLNAQGELVEYRMTTALMSDDFATVFEQNVSYAEQTVEQLGVESMATVYGSGVSAIDESSAVVLVGGTIELAYPSEGETVSSGEQRFRYVVDLVRDDEDWVVDDLNDIDDGLPPFSEPASGGDADDDVPVAEPNVSTDDWTGDVVAAAQAAVPAVFSYDYRTFDADLVAADELLTTEFADQRNALFDSSLRDQVLREEVVVRSEEVGTGLGAGDEETARVFVFLDQVSARKSSKDQTLRMWATLVMVHDGEEWLVSDVVTDG